MLNWKQRHAYGQWCEQLYMEQQCGWRQWQQCGGNTHPLPPQYTLTGATGSIIITNTVLVDAYPTKTVGVVPLTSTVMCGAVTLSAAANGNTLTARANFGGTALWRGGL